MEKAFDFSWQNRRGRIRNHRESKNILKELGLKEEEDDEEVKFGDEDGDDIKVCEWLFLSVCFIGFIAWSILSN